MLSTEAKPTVCLIHADCHERERLRSLIARHGYLVRDFSSAAAFLSERACNGRCCLVVDLGGPAACRLLERLRAEASCTSSILIAKGGDVPAAVRAMRAGASALIEKPYARSSLMREIRQLVD